jgi:hypothetical protein
MFANGYASEFDLITADNATATGTSAVDSTGVDCTGYDSVRFVVVIGTAAANNTAKLQESADNSAWADVTSGAVTNSGTQKVLILDRFRPAKKFVRVEVARGTSTTVDAIVAQRYRARTEPTTQTGALVQA